MKNKDKITDDFVIYLVYEMGQEDPIDAYQRLEDAERHAADIRSSGDCNAWVEGIVVYSTYEKKNGV